VIGDQVIAERRAAEDVDLGAEAELPEHLVAEGACGPRLQPHPGEQHREEQRDDPHPTADEQGHGARAAGDVAARGGGRREQRARDRAVGPEGRVGAVEERAAEAGHHRLVGSRGRDLRGIVVGREVARVVVGVARQVEASGRLAHRGLTSVDPR
jgi:hypothetical protein